MRSYSASWFCGVLLLSGCHVFSSSEIKFTCDDIPACTEEADADADVDADTDADADTDTDIEPSPEDCDDGKDNDIDGLTDCEDDDCLAECIEDCLDGIDNDQDTFTDCSDDECYGLDGCGGPYEVLAYTEFSLLNWAGGTDLERLNSDFNYNFVGYGYGTVNLEGTATGWTDDWFSCTGTIYGGFDISQMYDMFSYIGPHDGVDYAMSFSPSASGQTLYWDLPCPVDALPPITLGFTALSRSILRSDSDSESGWVVQYIASDITYTDYSGKGYDLHIDQLKSLSSVEFREWTGTY